MNKDFMYMPVIIFMVNIFNMKGIFFWLNFKPKLYKYKYYNFSISIHIFISNGQMLTISACVYVSISFY